MNENRERENPSEEFESSQTYYTDAQMGKTDPLDKDEENPKSAGISAEPKESAPEETAKYHNYELTAMILGILSLVLLSCCGLGVVLAIISIVFACMVRKMSPNKKMSGMAVAGLICSIISCSFAALFLLIYAFVFFLLGITLFM